MKAKAIMFGQPMQYNAKTNSNLPSSLEGKLVKLYIENENLILNIEDNTLLLSMTEKAKHDVIADLQYYKDTCLVRIDSINERTVLFTTLKFTKTVEFLGNEEMKFFLNKAIERDLRRLNISGDLVKFFKEEFIVDNVCFARTNEDLEKLTLIGTNYTCTFQRTPQNYMQAIEIKYLRSRSEIYGSIFVLRGNINFQDHLHNVQLNDETNRKYTESLKDTHELLKLWTLYSELEAEAAKEQIEEMGSLKYIETYNIIGENNRLHQVFRLSDKPSNIFLKSDIGYAIADENNFNKEDITATKKAIFIGTIAKTAENKKANHYEIIIELEDDEVIIPKTGYIIGSFAGSKKMAERRRQALDKILNGKTPLVNLKLILQSGISEDVLMKHETAVTDELLRRIFGTKSIRFTEKQQQAIDIAINSPDIAIIQGPPGTGKTTVIRAIIARLNKIYEGDVRILVSSAQHDAVDNAIENVEYGGLPVNRIGGKKTNQQKHIAERNILKWVEDISSACDELIKKEEKGYKRQILRDTLLHIQDIDRNKKNVNQVYGDLKKLHLLLQKLEVDVELIKRLELLILSVRPNTDEPDFEDIIEENEWLTLLKVQRVEAETFLDDGLQHLTTLIRYARASLEREYEIPEIWTKVRLATENEVVSLLPAFKESIQKSIRDEKAGDVIIKDTHIFEKGISALLEDLRKYFEYQFAGGQSSLSDIIWDFKDHLENPRRIEELINKYTKINAATCQQSVMNDVSSLKLKKKIDYDYVIIDEAARANPLDLLIPMSLGKRIILVGDHKQLPHLLEQSVVSSLLETKNSPEVKALLEEPLFSRLFTLLAQSESTVQKRTVMLRDQYRMHPAIANFVSENFYDSELISGVAAEAKHPELQRYLEKPVAWIDIPRKFGDEYASSSNSRSRKVEVTRVMEEIYGIFSENDDYTVGVITFYKKQALEILQEVGKLSKTAQERIEVGTVDSFQGKEFDVVILSTVRSNNHKEKKSRVGFLDSKNRLNVAFSRGKRCLVVIGDANTVAAHEESIVIRELYNYHALCKKEGYYEQL